MKNKVILVCLGVIACISATAQSLNFSVKKSSGGGGFDTEGGQPTGQRIQVEGKTFDLFKTDSGSLFVKAISEDGKPYPVWVGEPTAHSFEGKDVRKAKSGKYFVLKLTKRGFPHATYLEVN